MSNPYMATMVYRIPEAVITRICPDELRDWEVALGECAEANSVSVDTIFVDFATTLDDKEARYNHPDKMGRVEKAYKVLHRAFKERTGDLRLYPFYAKEGLPGSTISDECLWVIGNAQIMNPAFTALARKHRFPTTMQWHLDCAS